MIIRKTTEADISAAGEFYDNVVSWLDAHINYPKWTYKEYPSENDVRSMTASQSQYICLDGDKIIGAFVFDADPRGNYQTGDWKVSLEDGAYMVIHALAIDPEYQGRGLGSEIIGFCIEEAKKRGFKAIRVDIVPGNAPAQRLYENNGFTYAGEFDLERGIPFIPTFCLYELNW